ncbi:MAG TPA: C4-type zinc ribbon domain-containing protein [Candidatus Dormibacteraeota bacterium]
MNTGGLMLRHARVDERVQHLNAEIEKLEAALASNPRLDQARARLEEARSTERGAALRLRESEREVEGHRSKMRERDRELMSGRIRNPTDLTNLSTEVQHMRERLAVEEDAELELMQEVETHEEAVRRAELEAQRIQQESDAATPELRRSLEKTRLDLLEAETERAAIWAEIPATQRSVYEKIRVRPPVAEVAGTSCGVCRVGITTGGLQQLRRGELVRCDNCGRILVMG